MIFYSELSFRCPKCNKPYAKRNWIVICIFIFLSLWINKKFFDPSTYWCYWLEIIYFSIVYIIDHEHRMIPFPISIVGIALGSCLGYLIHGWRETAIGFIVGFGFVLVIFLLGYIFSKWIVKNINSPALGFGDVAIAGIAGLFLGFPLILISIFLLILVASLISIFWIIILIMKKQYQPFSKTLPMGGILSIITVILLLVRN
ncbi:MAG: A24 family peptidase [Chloroflexota bacterium]